VGATPRLTWQAPSLGAPSAYRIEIVGTTSYAEFFTSATELTLPPGLLAPGSEYIAVVEAVSGVDAARPFSISGRDATACIGTARFSP
jgi:hypothetical protein